MNHIPPPLFESSKRDAVPFNPIADVLAELADRGRQWLEAQQEAWRAALVVDQLQEGTDDEDGGDLHQG